MVADVLRVQSRLAPRLRERSPSPPKIPAERGGPLPSFPPEQGARGSVTRRGELQRAPRFIRADRPGRALAGAAGTEDGAAARLRPRGRPGAAGRVSAHRGVGAVSAHDHPQRSPDGGGDDELWRAGMGVGRTGYRYVAWDPETGRPWPPLPARLLQLARDAAAQAGFADFVPDACLIHRYLPDARMSLHQDRDERDLTAPIVSVSLGLPAVFLFGGLKRKDPTRRIPLAHGDVLVWGGPDRLRYHGVLPLEAGQHPLLGEQRINLTFRQAG